MALYEQNFRDALRTLNIDAGKKYLLACSGGIDSMVLLHLLHQAGITFGVAHVNYGLRGMESDGDMELVQQTCEEKNIPFHLMMAAGEMNAGSGSTQLKARNIRYDWFKKLLEEHQLAGVLTAHHKNDQAETVLMNLVRGTGLKGLRAMTPRNGMIFRPLLAFSREEINTYAAANHVAYRDDSSNFSSKYTRNAVRLDVMPLLEQINARALDHIAATASLAKDAWILLEGLIENKAGLYCEDPHLISRQLEKEPGAAFLLFHFLERFGLQEHHNQVLSPNTGVGALFYNENYELLVDREYWIIREKGAIVPAEQQLNPGENVFWGNWQISMEAVTVPSEFPSLEEEAYINADKISVPLTVRTWKEGDYMQPLGMKGRKKISDIFTEARLTLFEKQVYPVICCGSEIVCIPGLKLSEKYKASYNASCIRIVYKSQK